MAETSRTLEVLLELKDKLSGGLKKAVLSFGAFAKGAKGAIAPAVGAIFSLKAGIATLAAAVTGGAIAGLITGIAGIGDELAKTSKRTGLTVELLSRLKFAAEQSDASLDDLAKALSTLQKNAVAFRMGGEGAADAIKLLGRDFEEAVKNGLPAEELFLRFIDAFERLPTSQEKLFVSSKLLKDSTGQLIPLLDEGRESMEKLFREAERLGVTWSEDDAKAAEEFGDALGRLKGSVQGLLQEGLKPILPVLADLLDSMKEFSVEHRSDIFDFFDALKLGAKISAREIRDAITAVDEAAQRAGRKILGDELKRAIAERARIEEDLRKHREQFGGRFGQGLAGEDVLIPERFKERRVELERQLRLARELEREARGRLEEPKLSDVPIGPPAIHGPPEEEPPEIVRFGKATDAVKEKITGLEAGIVELAERWTDTFTQIKESIVGVGVAIEDNVVQGLFDASSHTKEWGEAMEDTGRSILADLQKIIIRLLVVRALGAIFGVTGLSSFATTLGAENIGRTTAPAKRSQFGTPRTIGPTLAGEGPIPEAVIPLQDGRSVPVKLLAGGGGQVVQIFVNAIDAKSFDEFWAQSAARQRRLHANISATVFQQDRTLRRRYA